MGERRISGRLQQRLCLLVYDMYIVGGVQNERGINYKNKALRNTSIHATKRIKCQYPSTRPTRIENRIEHSYNSGTSEIERLLLYRHYSKHSKFMYSSNGSICPTEGKRNRCYLRMLIFFKESFKKFYR